MPRRSKAARFRLRKSSEQIDRAVRTLLRDAWANVPSIRRRFEEAGMSPESIRGSTDLVRLPITDRTSFDLSRLTEHLRKGTRIHRCFVCTTSGTTGQRFAVYMSQTEALFRRWLLFRAIRENVRVAFPFSIVDVGVDTKLDERTRRFGIGQVTRISRLLPLDEQLDVIDRASPDVITSYPSCLELLAERLRKRRMSLRPLLVVSRGEELPSRVRPFLEETFGCRVVDYYNCEEVGNVAWECPHHRRLLHVQTDACVLEVVDAEGAPAEPGVVGRVIVTNLFNHTMPLIRHSLGDRAAIRPSRTERCTCGYRGVSLSPIEGREEDFFVQRDGGRISPRILASVMNDSVEWLEERQGVRVHRYSVTQETTGRIRVLMVTSRPLPNGITTRIGAAVQRIGLGAECTIDRVPEIPSEPSGKFRRFISHMSASGGYRRS